MCTDLLFSFSNVIFYITELYGLVTKKSKKQEDSDMLKMAMHKENKTG